eukprot:TRINITY_DN7660_c0_g1_i1.p1 TRINITY_DN7660_c0_g1~~TRINITY_DN7660_c0_g1_i1.p1  ORF type:complete len:162 (+),score=25.17 TRINITY_DN7660_c0_g1_i1:291-776(+)
MEPLLNCKVEESDQLTHTILTAIENDKKPFCREPDDFVEIVKEMYQLLITDEYTYEDIIRLFSEKYSKYQHRFTPGFCSKLRCGRILTSVTSFKRTLKTPRIKRVSKVSSRKSWSKMSYPLLIQMYEYEQNNPDTTKKQMEKLFNIHRSTYWRWKNKFSLK